MQPEVLIGDCREILPRLPGASVHCVVTSPPYFGLRDYGTGHWEGGEAQCDHRVRRWDGPKQTQGAQSGHAAGRDRLDRADCHCGARRIDRQIGLEESPEEYLETLVAVFREVKRVLRDEGTLWLNMGDSHAQGGKPATTKELAGDRERAKGRHYPTDAFAGYPGWNRAAGTAGNRYKPKDLLLMPFRLAMALQADGWYLRSAITLCKQNPMPESVTDRPTQATEMLFLLSKRAKYYYDADA